MGISKNIVEHSKKTWLEQGNINVTQDQFRLNGKFHAFGRYSDRKPGVHESYMFCKFKNCTKRGDVEVELFEDGPDDTIIRTLSTCLDHYHLSAFLALSGFEVRKIKNANNR